MKKMIYSSKPKREILYEGKYNGYQFYILNFGIHPTAYIEIPKEHKLYGKQFEKIYDMGIDINVHGGLTYSDSKLLGNENSWFIGWDYAHYLDYEGYEIDLPLELRTGGKKWTTEEIFEEVKIAIEQIKEVDL